MVCESCGATSGQVYVPAKLNKYGRSIALCFKCEKEAVKKGMIDY